jgi:hypothetical protein
MGTFQTWRAQLIAQPSPFLGSCQRNHYRETINEKAIQITMRRKDFKKLTPLQQAALQDLIREQPASVLGIKKEENKGFNDLPLFQQIQTKLL